MVVEESSLIEAAGSAHSVACAYSHIFSIKPLLVCLQAVIYSFQYCYLHTAVLLWVFVHTSDAFLYASSLLLLTQSLWLPLLCHPTCMFNIQVCGLGVSTFCVFIKNPLVPFVAIIHNTNWQKVAWGGGGVNKYDILH